MRVAGGGDEQGLPVRGGNVLVDELGERADREVGMSGRAPSQDQGLVGTLTTAGPQGQAIDALSGDVRAGSVEAAIGEDANVEARVPGPGWIEAAWISGDVFSLQWTGPDDPGTSPVTSYVLTYLEPGASEWKDLAEVGVDGPGPYVQEMRVATFGKYSFRIVAVNSAGPGEPFVMDDVQVG